MVSAAVNVLFEQITRAAIATSPGVQTDGQLLELFISGGHERAFEALVRRHGPMVLSVCRRILGNIHDAEDAFQATFVVLARRATSVLPPDLVGNWLYGVAYRVATKARTASARRRARERSAAQACRPAVTKPSERSGAGPFLDECLQGLSEKYRTPIVLCHLEGRSRQEAARLLRVSPGTLSSRLARGRKLLAKRLSRRGLTVCPASAAHVLSELGTGAVVPARLRLSIVKAASDLAGTGACASTVVSAQAIALAAAVSRNLTFFKPGVAAVLLCAITLIGAGSRALVFGNAFSEGSATPKLDGLVARDAVVRESLTKFYRTGQSPHIVVEMYGGTVDVRADTDATVESRVMRCSRADTDEAARDVLRCAEYSATQEGNVIRVTARPDRKRDRRSHFWASAELRVPASATLELRTRNASISVTRGSGAVVAETSNGAIRVKDHRGSLQLNAGNDSVVVIGGAGRLDLTAGNGCIEIDASDAVVTATSPNGPIVFRGSLADGNHCFHSGNGPITVAGARGQLDIRTSNGDVDIHSAGAVVTAESRCGAIRCRGGLSGGKHFMRTSDGKIDVSLPTGSEFIVDAASAGGTVINEFANSQGDATSVVRYRPADATDSAVYLKVRAETADDIAIHRQSIPALDVNVP
jgi:RNA polymerase sigma factor (sigma-70 family)